jgi:cupin superfamily acireductone dioxygenase involved in methionine salvage
MDIIKFNVPTFLRVLELVREEVKNDPDIHDITEIATMLSKQKVISMEDYDTIVTFMHRQGNDNKEVADSYQAELNRIRHLGGF